MTYNGFSAKERDAKLQAMKRLIAEGTLPPASGPCRLCGDPDIEVEYHDEDYSHPYVWVEPATYVLCRHCHRQKLHGRYAHAFVWQAFLAHVRRGGYASDLLYPHIKLEVHAFCMALKTGQEFELHSLRPYTKYVGDEWFARLDKTGTRQCVANGRKP